MHRLLATFLGIAISITMTSCAKKEPPKEIVKKPPIDKKVKEKKFIACKLTRNVKKGEKIGQNDVAYESLKWSKVPYGTIYTSLGVIGGVASKDLEKDAIVSYKDVEKLPTGTHYMMHGTMRKVAPEM